ncbi:MAG: VanW family protein [Bacteroidetes bacterium]|nr:VanW family protein [Bacteroidota bacterium]
METTTGLPKRVRTGTRFGNIGRLKRPPGLAGVIAAACLILITAGSSYAYQSVHAGHIFPGVKVGDMAIGGISKEQALAKLQPWLEEHLSEPVTMRVPEMGRTATAADLGASFDASSAVDAAFEVGRSGGFSAQLGAQFRAITGGYTVKSPGLRVDRSTLTLYLERRAQEIDRPVKDARLEIGADLVPRVSPSVVGRELDVSAAANAVERALSTGATSVDLPVVESQPKVVESDLESARTRAAVMLSGPAALQLGERSWTITPKEIAAAISIKPEPGSASPVVSLSDEPLKKLVDEAANEIDQPKLNARFDWNGGNLKLLRPGQDGRQVDKAKALEALTSAISSSQKTAPLPVGIEKAAGNDVDPSKLGIKELVDSASTSFAGSVSAKAFNITLAASRLNGVLLAPGDVFSFNKELGPTTLKSGFQVGFGIAVNSGEMQTVPSVAGGICQVSTTLLHSIFWAGYEIEEIYPHLYWISAYGVQPKGMIGLDATVDAPNLDFKFKNNTDNYLLIQSKVEGSNLEFSIYGTKPKWKVDVNGPIITNVVKADQTPVRQEEASWPAGKELWVERAGDGMYVTIIRKVTDGADARTLTLKAHYLPSKNVLMVGTGPAAAPALSKP